MYIQNIKEKLQGTSFTAPPPDLTHEVRGTSTSLHSPFERRK